MHTLQPKHSKLSKKEEENLLLSLNISKTFLEAIPIPELSESQLIEINNIVDIILNIASTIDYTHLRKLKKAMSL